MSDSCSHSRGDLVTPVRSFPTSKAELNLSVVLKCGQTFRWNQIHFQLSSQHPLPIHTEDRKPPIEPDLPSQLVEWSFAWIDRTIVLRQDDHCIHYVAIYKSTHVLQYQNDLKLDTTHELLKAYFVLDVSLVKLYHDWSERDPHFSSKVACGRWDGLRVCRQDGWETMVSFICSANNNIPRISLMLQRLCASFGNPMPSPLTGVTLCDRERHQIKPLDSSSQIEMYSFPSPNRLSQPDVPEKLKLLGFGYRANYVHKTAIKLCEIALEAQRESRWPGFDADDMTKDEDGAVDGKEKKLEPENYLIFLAQQTYQVAHSKLVNQFAGIGPKVADCICLFGLGFVHVVPVDVHIYKIALRDYQFEIVPPTKKAKRGSSQNQVMQNQSWTNSSSNHNEQSSRKTKRKKNDGSDEMANNQSQAPIATKSSITLSKINYSRIQNFFNQLWGPWAGWTQQILFLADLNKTPN